MRIHFFSDSHLSSALLAESRDSRRDGEPEGSLSKLRQVHHQIHTPISTLHIVYRWSDENYGVRARQLFDALDTAITICQSDLRFVISALCNCTRVFKKIDITISLDVILIRALFSTIGLT